MRKIFGLFIAILFFISSVPFSSVKASDTDTYIYKCSITITKKHVNGKEAYGTGKCKDIYTGYYSDGYYVDGYQFSIKPVKNGQKIVDEAVPVRINGHAYPTIILTVYTDTPTIKKVNKTVYVTASKLNVRASASSKAKVVTTLKKGTKIKVTAQKGNWYKVSVNKKTGWVSKKYVSTKKPVTTKTMYANANTSLKAKANSKSKTILKVKKGQKITIYSTTSGNYYKAKVNGKTGWVLKKNVTSKKPVTTKTMYANANTSLKAKANSKSKTILKVKKGQKITIYSTTSGKYYKAKVNGKTGWILKSKVSNTKIEN